VSYLGSIVILLIQDASFNSLIDSILGGEKTKILVWLSISYTMIALPAGMLLANLVFGFSRREIPRYVNREIRTLLSRADSYIRYPLYFFSLISICAVIYTFVCIGYLPILKVFGLGSETEVLQLRYSVDIGFKGNVYIRNLFGSTLTPVLTFIAYVYYRKTKSVGDLVWFSVMFLFAFLILTYDSSKSPFVKFLTGFVFLHVLLKGKIPFNKLFVYIIVVFGLLIATFTIFGKKDSLVGLFFSYNEGITGRLLIDQVSSLYNHFEIFPKDYNYIGFRSLSKGIPLMEGSDRSGRLVMEHVRPDLIKDESGGVYNTLFIGEAYANFGWWGVFLAPFWVGFVIQGFHIFLLRLPKTPLFLGVFVFFSYNSNITGGFNEYIYDPLVIMLLGIIFTVYVLGVYLKRSKELNNESRLQGPNTFSYL
jgi:oligosaccharide repeat unit polymerase